MSGSPGAARDPGQARLLPQSLDGCAGGARWGLWALPDPAQPARGAVLAVQATLDEQALSRRMLVHALHALAGAGWTALVVDPYGTGDSAGWHDQASLTRWRADLLAAAALLRQRAPTGPLALLGVRLGALLAIDLAGRLPTAPQGLVLWNPPASGAALLDPLRRLARLGPPEPTGSAAPPASGASRLAGWPIDPGMVEALRGLRLDAAPPAGGPGRRLAIVQTQRLLAAPASEPTGSAAEPPSGLRPAQPAADASAPPAIAGALPAWQRAGWAVHVDRLGGEPWWSAMDACDPEPLTQRTLAALAGVSVDAHGTPDDAPRPPPVADPAAADATAAGDRAACTHEARTHETASCTAAPCEDARSEAASVEPARAALPRFEPMVIAGDEGDLVGAFAPGTHAPAAAVLIVPGQPQTRVGAHRMFVTLAAGLHERGIASLRIDIGGWGDSLGVARPFEAAGDDIVAAARALRARAPDAALWLYGLCDGASALAIALPALRRAGVRVRGICLLNPWVRSDATLARAMIGNYYARRLTDPAFWARLLRGQVPWRNLIVEPLRVLATRLGRPLGRQAGAGRGYADATAASRGGASAPASGPTDPGASLPLAMIDRLEAFEGEVLTVLSGADLTAAETEALLASDPRWRARLARSGRLLRLPGADHGLSDPAHERAAIDWLATRIAELAAPR